MFKFPTQGARPVWIASYPRSGNTFLRIILESVFHLPTYSLYYVEGEEHRDPSAEALGDAPRLPLNWRKAIGGAGSTAPVIIKTHDPPQDNAPAVFIARDGRASIDSYFHYHKKFAFEQPSLTEIIAGACQFGSWSTHYRAWAPKTRPNTLLLRYDDLVNKPEAAISKLAEFLKLKPLETRLPAFEELQKRLPAFFRRGQNTDYLQAWTPAQLALFNQLHGEVMLELGYPLTPTSGTVADAATELAQSAARLHRLYLEQLVGYGQCVASHRKEMEQLTDCNRQLLEQHLNPLLHTKWVRLGLALGAIHPPSQARKEPRSRSDSKASGGNTRSSSPGPGPGPLSAPSADTSAPG